MQETVSLAQISKTLKKIWSYPELQPIFITLGVYTIGLVVFVVLGATDIVKFNVASGWTLGILFALLGYGILLFSCWIVQFTLNSYMFYFCFLLRLFLYALAILIFAIHPHTYSLFSIIGGLILIHFATYIIRTIPQKQKDKPHLYQHLKPKQGAPNHELTQ